MSAGDGGPDYLDGWIVPIRSKEVSLPSLKLKKFYFRKLKFSEFYFWKFGRDGNTHDSRSWSVTVTRRLPYVDGSDLPSSRTPTPTTNDKKGPSDSWIHSTRWPQEPFWVTGRRIPVLPSVFLPLSESSSPGIRGFRPTTYDSLLRWSS